MHLSKAIRILILLPLIAFLVACGGNPPLLNAVLEGDLSRTTQLLSGGADPNSRAENGVSALSYAARRGELAIVRVLLANGADPNDGGNGGFPPLYASVADEGQGSVEMIQTLIAAGADVHKGWTEGWTPLLVASRYQSAAEVQALLDAGANINDRNSSGLNALHLAVFRDSPEIAELLIRRGLSPQAVKNDGVDALQYARNESSTVRPEFMLQVQQEYEAQRQIQVMRESLQQLEQRIAAQRARDAGLPAQISRDKYLVAFSDAMKASRFADAVFYANLLERTGLPVDDSLYYFWGDALINLGDKAGAVDKLQQYLQRTGSAGQYYTQALSLMLQAES